jgi:hypothetical protein
LIAPLLARLIKPHGADYSRKRRIGFREIIPFLSTQALSGDCLEEPVSKENSKLERSERRDTGSEFGPCYPSSCFVSCTQDRARGVGGHPVRSFRVRNFAEAVHNGPAQAQLTGART